jgi:prepilin-type N-terminal cleavage/methylation domain-containing protein
LNGTGARTRSGFTLLEVLVALGVVSIATWIFISLFVSSLSFANLSRTHRVAAGLAEEQLAQAVRNPGELAWPDAATLEPGKPVPLKLKASDVAGPYPIDAPKAKALNPRVGNREQNFYSAFTWQPFAVLPAADAPYLELIAVVRWNIEGKDYSLSLTSAVPRTQLEGRS